MEGPYSCRKDGVRRGMVDNPRSPRPVLSAKKACVVRGVEFVDSLPSRQIPWAQPS